MTELRFTVPADIKEIRVQDFLRKQCGVSRTLLVALKKDPVGLTANGVSVRTIDVLYGGDEVLLHIPDDPSPAPIPDDAQPIAKSNILFEDSHLLVVNKPAGLPVHPSNGHREKALSHAITAYLREKGEFISFRPVNRLDKDTSGIILAAKNPHVAHVMVGAAEKTYFAICEGTLEGSGTISLPIHLKPGFSIQREAGEHGQHAVTHWKALGHFHNHSILSLQLETGRTHQIRVHLSAIGHPLAGDTMYGGNRSIIGRQALHCATTQFAHPITNLPVSLKTPLPEDFIELMKFSGLFGSKVFD